jgi:hypothetical protein
MEELTGQETNRRQTTSRAVGTTNLKVNIFQYHKSATCLLRGLLSDSEDGGSIFFRNVIGLLPDYMALHPTRWYSAVIAVTTSNTKRRLSCVTTALITLHYAGMPVSASELQLHVFTSERESGNHSQINLVPVRKGHTTTFTKRTLTRKSN